MNLIKNEAGRWEVRIKGSDGKIKSFSTHQKDRRNAEKVVQEAKVRELELASEMGILTQNVVSVLVSGKRTTVEDAIPEWTKWLTMQHRSPKTIENQEMWVKAWATAQNVLRAQLTALDEEDIDPWVNSPGPNKSGTRRIMLSALRSFFMFCTSKGWLMGNPANLVRVDLGNLLHSQKETELKVPFADHEVNLLRMITAPDGGYPSAWWNAAITIGRYTGLRLGDIASLEWDCLAVPGKISVWTDKRDKRVELDLVPEALAQTIQGIEKRDERYLFPRARDLYRDPKRRAQLSTNFARLLAHAQIYGKSFHCLRASYCTACDVAGIPIEHIARRVGHSDTETTEGYIRPV